MMPHRTPMSEAAAVGHWRLRQQWYWQKQWDSNDGNLDREIRSEFHRILQLLRFRTFCTPEFSSEFNFSDYKICSRRFATQSRWFGILSCHWFFQFHSSENVPAICQWHVASNFKTQCTNSFFVHHRHHTAHNIYQIHTNLWKPYFHIQVLAPLLKYQYRHKWMLMMKISLVFILAPVRNPS